MSIKPFGQNVIAQVATAKIASNPSLTETKKLVKSSTTETNVDGFVSSNAKTVTNIGNMPSAAATALNKYVGLSSDDIAQAGPSPSFTNKLMANVRKAPEFPTSFPQGAEATQAA